MGSMERMIAILCEHYAGKWPLWISPRQIMIVPISEVSMGERPSSFTARRLSR
jgi:threonyl-tRNA synthetase